MKRCCVVVDGVAGGARLGKSFRARGYRCVHVRTFPNSDERLLVDFDATQFDELLDYDGTNFELFAHRLVDTYNPAFAAVGCEEGVELGDCLNEVIGRPHHGSELRKRLRHKHLMNRAVRQAGLPVPASLLARTRDEAAQLAEELRSWPLVIKPKDSSGADGVRLCHNLEDVQTIANLLFSKPNIMNERNTEIVIQSYVPGRKMTVDTISDGGEHFVTSVWLDQVVVTQGGSPVMRGARLLPGSRPDALAAAQAARQCLDALGIQHGPAMMEFIEYNNAFYFIEINARLCGLPVWHEEFQRALNFTQDQIYAAWLCNEVDLRRILAQPYHLARHVWWVAALSTRDAVVRNFHGLDCISRLPSFVCILSCAKGGERIRPTEDLFSFPLTALLSNADEGKIIRDFNAFETIGDDVLFSFH